jgi:hypothetical protein
MTSNRDQVRHGNGRWAEQGHDEAVLTEPLEGAVALAGPEWDPEALTALKAKRDELFAAFEAAGGRGVDEAEEIDRLDQEISDMADADPARMFDADAIEEGYSGDTGAMAAEIASLRTQLDTVSTELDQYREAAGEDTTPAAPLSPEDQYRGYVRRVIADAFPAAERITFLDEGEAEVRLEMIEMGDGSDPVHFDDAVEDGKIPEAVRETVATSVADLILRVNPDREWGSLDLASGNLAKAPRR